MVRIHGGERGRQAVLIKSPRRIRSLTRPKRFGMGMDPERRPEQRLSRANSQRSRRNHRDDRESANSVRSTEREVDVGNNPTVLFQCINHGDWRGATSRAKSHPEEAAHWIVRHCPVPDHTPLRGKRRDNSKTRGVKWKYLPLHLVCLQQEPPMNLIRQLLQAFPEGIRRGDHDGNLPIHHTCATSGDAAPDLLKMLVSTYPNGLLKKNGKGRTPADLLRRKLRDRTYTAGKIQVALALLDPVDELRGSKDECRETKETGNSDDFCSRASANKALLQNEEGGSNQTRRKIRKLQCKLGDVSSQRDMLQERLKSIQEKRKMGNSRMEGQIKDLNVQITTLEKRARASEKLRREYKYMQRQVESASKENARLRHLADSIIQERDELQRELSSRGAVYEKSLRVVGETAKEEENEIVKSKASSNWELTKGMRDLELALGDINRERDELEIERNELGQERDGLLNRCHALEEQAAAYEDEKHAARSAAEVKASKGKAQFNQRQERLRKEIQSIWACVQRMVAAPGSSSSASRLKNEILEHIMELDQESVSSAEDGMLTPFVKKFSHGRLTAEDNMEGTSMPRSSQRSAVSLIDDEDGWADDTVCTPEAASQPEWAIDKNIDLTSAADDHNDAADDEETGDDDWLDEMAHEIEVLEEEARNLLAMDLDS